MKRGIAVVQLCLILLSIRSSRSESLYGFHNSCETLYLLNLYPAPDESKSTGFDKGLELIPAGHLATQHINSDPSVLRGHRIELIDVPTEACEQTLIIEGLTNYYEQVLNPDGVCIYGIVGLYCSTVTNVIAPITSHPNTGYVQLAASTSPAHRNVTRFPYTFHTISSTRVINEAIVEMMNEFMWRNVSIIYDSLSVLHRSSAQSLITLLGSNSSLLSILIEPFLPVSKIFEEFIQKRTRIGYIAASNYEIAAFFCEAYRRNFLWPNYAYIVVESSLEGILDSRDSKDCSAEQLTKALNGTFLLKYRLHHSERSEIVISGRTYAQFHDEYLKELEDFAEEKQMNLQDNSYADTLYDQVWAFALALNMSLDNINILNDSISRGNLNDRAMVRETLATDMKDVNFIGASGTVKFGKENEVFTKVEICQILNGDEVLVGTYNSFNSKIDFNVSFEKNIVPGDRFEVRFKLAPIWMGALFITASIAVFLITLFNTAVTIFLKKKPEIKSSSFSLNLAILLGCGILSIAPIFATVLATIAITDTQLFTSICNLELWTLFVGITIILAALFVRLLRIYNIFRPYNHSGKYWSDKYLLVYAALVCFIMIALLAVWTAVDRFSYSRREDFIESAPSYFQETDVCTSKHEGIWFTIAFGFIGCIMILLVFFAIQTRHVKIKNFKDTKKVNVYIFLLLIMYAVFVPLWLTLSHLGFFTAAYVCECIAMLAGAVLSQVLLLLPKTIPAVQKFCCMSCMVT